MDEAKEKDRAIEIRIYKRLGDHPRVCKYIQDVKSGIVLERLGKNLRMHLQGLLQDGSRGELTRQGVREPHYRIYGVTGARLRIVGVYFQQYMHYVEKTTTDFF
jgi:hypothetical protein